MHAKDYVSGHLTEMEDCWMKDDNDDISTWIVRANLEVRLSWNRACLTAVRSFDSICWKKNDLEMVFKTSDCVTVPPWFTVASGVVQTPLLVLPLIYYSLLVFLLVFFI